MKSNYNDLNEIMRWKFSIWLFIPESSPTSVFTYCFNLFYCSYFIFRKSIALYSFRGRLLKLSHQTKVSNSKKWRKQSFYSLYENNYLLIMKRISILVCKRSIYKIIEIQFHVDYGESFANCDNMQINLKWLWAKNVCLSLKNN